MQDLKLAVLIDADNISPKYVKVILDEAASFGVAACKRIYGDWSDARLKSWKDVLLNNSIIPIQQYSYTPPVCFLSISRKRLQILRLFCSDSGINSLNFCRRRRREKRAGDLQISVLKKENPHCTMNPREKLGGPRR